MTIERWSPFSELRRMDDVFNRFWRTGSFDRGSETWGIPLDVVQSGDNLTVTASGPDSLSVVGLDSAEVGRIAADHSIAGRERVGRRRAGFEAPRAAS